MIRSVHESAQVPAFFLIGEPGKGKRPEQFFGRLPVISRQSQKSLDKHRDRLILSPTWSARPTTLEKADWEGPTVPWQHWDLGLLVAA